MTVLRYGHFLRRIAMMIGFAIALAMSSPVGAHASNAVLVLDGSRSMWGEIDGTPKYKLVQEAFASLALRRQDQIAFGLVSFGDQSQSRCTDVFERARPQAGDNGFVDALASVRPLGMSPVARALAAAANTLDGALTNHNIVLVTDSLDICRGDPCAVAADLKSRAPGLVIDVIALAMSDADEERLSCIARETDGRIFTVASGADLAVAVSTVAARIVANGPRPLARDTGDTPIFPEGTLIEPATGVEPSTVLPLTEDEASGTRGAFTPLPDGVFAYPREQVTQALAAPPPLALPGAVPPLPQINPFWQFKLMAQLRPREKPSHLVDPTDFEIMVDLPPEFEPVEFGPVVAEAETHNVDPIETGTVSDPEETLDSELETVATPPSPDTAAAPDPESQSDTATDAPEVDIRSNPDADHQGLRLRARLTAAMDPISRPVQWTVFAVSGDDPALWPQITAIRASQPLIALPVGNYQVEVRYGHVVASKPLSVEQDAITDATFVLNAGGLRILSHLVFVDAPPNETALHFIYSGATDENGMRDLIARSEIQGEIIRLNAGSYRLISRLGSANSVVETDVEVSPGVLTAVEINHKAGVVQLSVPIEEGDTSTDGATLQILDETGSIVARIHGQNGHAILAPGTYIAVAEIDGRTERREFRIRIGEAMSIELEID